jgi:dynein heavy chain
MEHFDPEVIQKKNSAAAGLCTWVVNIVKYYDIWLDVEPKRIKVQESTEKLDKANGELAIVREQVAELQAQLDVLTEEYNRAESDKKEAVDTAERGKLKLELAQRLTVALGSEEVRWAQGIKDLEASGQLLVGDVLLASAFISYIGPFTKPFRISLLEETWLPYLRTAAGGQPVPMNPEADVLSIITNDAQIAGWNTQGLPSDPVSSENGAIVHASNRWPLLIDPQLQGVAWLKERDKDNGLQVTRLGNKDIVQVLERSIEHGFPVIIENMGEKIDAMFLPIVQRAIVMKSGKPYLTLGENEVEMHSRFRLFLHTKLSNPHYPPELQAELTLVNFTVTPSGLEDQLLALVVRKERPDLASRKTAIIHQSNEFLIKIKDLEDDILKKLSSAEGDITEDKALIEGLEDAKRQSTDAGERLAEGKEITKSINVTAERFRTVAARGSVLFFLMNNLYKIHTYYIYSLNAFVVIFQHGIDLVQEAEKKAASSKKPKSMLSRLKAASSKVIQMQRFNWNADLLRSSFMPDAHDFMALTTALKTKADAEAKDKLTDEEFADRCSRLKDSITSVVFNYVRRGLFERDKLCVATLLTFAVMEGEGQLNSRLLEALLQSKAHPEPPAMSDEVAQWLPEPQWARVKGVEDMCSDFVRQFENLGENISGDADEWNEWYNHAEPETRAMPGDYREMGELEKLLLLRALRPDRITFALSKYITNAMPNGENYVTQQAFDMQATYMETSASTPIFFVLFPGVDPTPWIEELGRSFDVSTEAGNFVNISMGQGQEKPAEAKLESLAESGGWLMLQNLHLMQSWLPMLDRKLEIASESAHHNFRCFISAEPPPVAFMKNLPEALLQSCIKVANEAPADLKSNLRRAWALFSQERLDGCSRPKEFRACLFGLVFFHSLMLGRKRFGQQGFSRQYGFNAGDLTICANVLDSYLNAAVDAAAVPWDDLRYIFGEIMYGGHITDFWDRRTDTTYLAVTFTEKLLQGKELAPLFLSEKSATPKFMSPQPADFDYAAYANHIEKALPSDAPPMFGLHPNAEIGYLTMQADTIFETVLRLLAGEQSPYVVVALQECGQVNVLLGELTRSLSELQKGLNGQLNMSQPMEDLAEALSLNEVPGRNPFHLTSWEKLAWPSRKNLPNWFSDFLKRVSQLRNWSQTLELPYSLWLPALFNPTAFLTAVKQVVARRNGLPLDNMATETHVTIYSREAEVIGKAQYPTDGAFVHGLYIEGARWSSLEEAEEKGTKENVSGTDCAGSVVDSKLKELLPPLPVIYVKAVQVKPTWIAESVGYMRPEPQIYNCPVYLTTFRGPTYICLATLKTKEPSAKWVLAGVALMMQTDGE